MNLILCGLPGCGKTTVGKLLAEKLGRVHIESDRMIEQEDNTETCREIYFRKGEAGFRQLETRVIEKLLVSSPRNVVISLGGGTLTVPKNLELLKSIGTLIYLQVQNNELFLRITRKGFPAYLDPRAPLESFEALAAKRTPLFSNAADLVICGDGLTPEEIVELIQEEKNAAST